MRNLFLLLKHQGVVFPLAPAFLQSSETGMKPYAQSSDWSRIVRGVVSVKLWKEVYESNNLTKRTDYVGEFVYEDGKLAFVLYQSSEGDI